jgi:hypothetical protein
MANITEEHLHHMARRHHATMQKLDGIREKILGVSHKTFGVLETGFGAWLGGVVEGRFNGLALGPVPINLLGGIALIGLGYSNIGAEKGYSEHFSNLGNGLLASYTSAMGYNFGKNWREGKKLFGPSTPLNPYDDDVAPPPPPPPPAQASGWYGGYPVQGDLDEEQMAAIVQRMQAAAAAPAHP